jgi:hypothetical protein
MIRNRLVQAFRPQLARSAVVLACTVAASGYVVASEQAVGQVSLLIGVARVVHLNGSSEPLKRGASILVGDRVETSANGHVHVRFIDNGAVSVRPDSILEVQAYRYDAEKPQANEVRLRMEQGTSRSISGAATDADKNRFRLNTPIAAIGVRGTDFIVQSDASGVRATVADGAIVVGALGNGCSAAALGPCAGADARLLSADMSGLMAEVRPGDRTTRVVPATGGIAALAGAEERAAALHAAETAARAAGAAAAETQVYATMRESDRVAAELLAIPPLSTEVANAQPPASSQLMWGRWAYSGVVNDNVSVKYTDAAQGRAQVPMPQIVGGALYRQTDPSNPENLLRPDTNATVTFKLNYGQASFEPTGGKGEAASIDGGTLKVDFARRNFATGLALSSVTGGKTELRIVGDITENGTFAVQTPDKMQKVNGALSLDGKEAGYFFERIVGNGLFKGKTLWGR